VNSQVVLPHVGILTHHQISRQQQLATITLYRGFTVSKQLSKGSSIYAPGSPLTWLAAQSSLAPQGQLRYIGVLSALIHIGSLSMDGTTRNAAQETNSSARSNRVLVGMGRSCVRPREASAYHELTIQH
jgi:hypothetical protein